MSRSSDLRLLNYASLLCLAVLIACVLWASGRGLELTDESYYILSALYPEQVNLYVSAQHWVLGPLWTVTESLQGFRLTGAAILVGSSAMLAFGACHAFALTTGQSLRRTDRTMTVAAGCIGALLYVSTIAPSPSYNLLASAGAYAALGLALIALGQTSSALTALLGFLGGLALAVAFVVKPSAGICVGLVIFIIVLGLQSRRRGLTIIAAGLAGSLVALTLLVAVQPHNPAILDSLRGGLELFRMVQTEPIGRRLVRYALSLLLSVGKGFLSFSIVLFLLFLWYRSHKHWLLALAGMACVLTLFFRESYLGGMLSYRRMAEAIYVLVVVITMLAFNSRQLSGRTLFLIGGLLVLPFATSIGTGNSLFTQVIVALAPWTVVGALLACVADPMRPVGRVQVMVTALLFALLTAQTASSFFREPYHLAQPLLGQTVTVRLPHLGVIKVDPETATFIDQINLVRDTCGLEDGTHYLGFYNLPGVALALSAVPPVTPWINNSQQADMVLRHWSPDRADRVILALSADVQADLDQLPQDFQRVFRDYQLCGQATVPYDGQKIEIWASPARVD